MRGVQLGEVGRVRADLGWRVAREGDLGAQFVEPKQPWGPHVSWSLLLT